MAAELAGTAVFSPDGLYRYELTRQWDPDGAAVLFVMLNPSTATADTDDPTIRRCIGFARAWGFGTLRVANLYAYRATDPVVLRTVQDPIGPDNDAAIMGLSVAVGLSVVAWGAHPLAVARGRQVARLLFRPHCIGTTKAGHPRHPLYARGKAQPIRWGGYRG